LKLHELGSFQDENDNGSAKDIRLKILNLKQEHIENKELQQGSFEFLFITITMF